MSGGSQRYLAWIEKSAIRQSPSIKSLRNTRYAGFWSRHRDEGKNGPVILSIVYILFQKTKIQIFLTNSKVTIGYLRKSSNLAMK